jgi:uncharacterized protein YndB with AHSA1/START domain
MREFAHTLVIAAPADAVLAAFFDADALAEWWRARRSLCVPRPLGSYALEWDPTEWSDELLGRLGGAFRGTVIEFVEGHEFFVADAYWLPPDGDPIGPMALLVRCGRDGDRTVLHVRQSGWEESRRWSRYYEVIGAGLTLALGRLKVYVEGRTAASS